MTFSTWSQTAASNTSVGGISTDGTVTLVKQIDNMFRGMMAELAVARDDGTVTAVGERGYLHGLTTSNSAGDLTNDIDIAAGECAAENSPYWKMALASALTKRLDAAWAVGTNQGGLDTGSIANTTYHVWLIQRSDTGVVDALFSTSATAPTMPANYDRKRRIGSIIRESAAIVLFFQFGDVFTRKTATNFYSSTSSKAAALTAVGVPLGIVCQPRLLLRMAVQASSQVTNDLGDAVDGTILGTVQVCLTPAGTTGLANTFINGGFFTNTSGQIYHGVGITSGSIIGNLIDNIGWIDNRGRTS